MKEYGWNQIVCSYFSENCINELAGLFEQEGFTIARVESHGPVVFKRFDVFIEIGYVLESAPNYSPTVVIGFGEKKYDESGRPACVPLWFVISEDESARRYSFWTFSNELQLQQVLRRIWVEVLDHHVRPLWERTELLESALSKFRSEVV